MSASKLVCMESLRGAAKKAAYALLTAAVVLVLCLPMFSQANQGTIQGAVLDQTGGAIAGATVTIVDVARGVTRTLVSDSAGEYVYSNVTPGTYTVRAEAKGFQGFEHSGVLVEVGQNIRVDLTLQPGEQNQTITVTGEVPSVDTTDATLGGAVSNQSILALPLNGRNFERLLQLRPGVVTSPGSTSGASSTNGRRSGSDVLLVEGIPQIELTTAGSTLNGSYKGGGDASNLLPIDAIQEFSTEQDPKAEFGWRDGSVVNVAVKSGTNSLHGTAYAFGRDASATDAANALTQKVTPATLEQFGGSAGGPVLKNKIFWFVNFEALRVNVSDVTVVTVPSSVAMAPGADPASQLSMVDACKALGPAKINALSAQLAGLNPTTCVVTPGSSSFENLFPFITSTTSNRLAPGLPNTAPLNNGLVKGDWDISQHHHLNGMYYISKSTALSTSGNLLPQWSSNIFNDTRMYDGNWTWTPNSTWVNDARLGYSYGANQLAYGDQSLIASHPYPNGYSLNTGVTNPLYGGLPNIVINSFSGSLGVGGRTGIRGPDGEAQFEDAVSYLRGKHAFKFGFEYVDAVLDQDAYGQAQGVIKFSNLQNYLQGTVNTAAILAGDPTVNVRQHWFAGFAQDDWRVTQRINVSLGLRYEYYATPTERNDLLGSFDPSVNPATTPAVQQVKAGESMYTPEKTDFLPRVGFAWDVQGNGKTVVRAGGGLMSSIIPLTALSLQVPWGANFPSIGVNTTGTFANLHTPNPLSFSAAQINWSQAGPIFPLGTVGPSCTPAVPCSTGSYAPNFTQPKSAYWNFDIQRVITNNLTLDVAFVGNHGYDEQHTVDLNMPPIGTGYTPAVIAACIAAPTSAHCAPSATAIQNAEPYHANFPYLNYIIENESNYHSNYDALQVTVDKRVSHGLNFLVGYTYGHALDEWSKNSNGSILPSNPNNPGLGYGNSDFDIRNRFTFSPNYLLPGIKSPGQMLEGWSVAGILTLQGGLPWYPLDNTSDDWLGTGENKDNYASTNPGIVQPWNYTGPVSAFTSTANPIPCYGNLAGCTAMAAAPASIQAACTTAATAPYGGSSTQNGKLALAALSNFACYAQNGGILTPPAYGTIGNESRNMFRSQPYYNVDLSISKLWHFKERYSAQFRAEFFNLFNRADFSTPAPNSASTDPSGGVTAGFGYALSTPDTSNPVLGSGGPRHIQFGLKLTF